MSSKYVIPLVALLCGSALGQSASHDNPYPPGVGGPGAFTDTISGHFTGDLNLDVAVIDGGRAVVLFAPGSFAAVKDLGIDADSMARLYRGAFGNFDAIAISNASGTYHVYLESDGTVTSSVISESANYRMLSHLQGADITNDGIVDLFGVSPGGLEIRTLIGQPGNPSAFTPGLSAVSDAPILDVLAFQYDLDSELEIAALTTAGVTIFDNKVAVASYAGNVNGDHIARIRQANDTRDRIAWITRDSSDIPELRVIDQTGSEAPVSLFADLSYVALRAIDIDDDGNSDLVCSIQAAQRLVFLFNQTDAPGATSTFSVAGLAWLDLDASPLDPDPTNMASPAIGDFDNDGDIDVVFLWEAGQVVKFFQNNTYDVEQRRVALEDSSFYEAAYYESTLDPSAAGTLHVTATKPVNFDTEATHVEVMVWRQPDSTTTTAHDTIQHELFLLPLDWYPNPPANDPPADTPVDLFIDIDESTGGTNNYPFDAIYRMEIRLVKYNASKIVRAWSTLHCSWSCDEVIVEGYLNNLPGAYEESVTYFLPTGPFDAAETPAPNSVETGCIVTVCDGPDIDELFPEVHPPHPEPETHNPPPP